MAWRALCAALAFGSIGPSRIAPGLRSGRSTRPLRAAAGDEPAAVVSYLGRRTVGVDYGFRRTGVALSTGYSPRPFTVIDTANNSSASHEHVVAELLAIASRTASVQFVVGMPLDQAGGERNDQSVATRTFATRLSLAAQQRGYHVYVWDERGSTMEARLRTKNAVLKRNRDLEHVDALAAAVILEDFFAVDGKGAERLTDLQVAAEATALAEAARGRAQHAAAPVPSYQAWQQQARERARKQREDSAGS